MTIAEQGRDQAIPLYSTADIRAIEVEHARIHPKVSLMERAGKAVAKFAIEVLKSGKSKRPVLVLAGPGNNGGDAWVAARSLQTSKIPVFVWALGAQEFAAAAAQKAHAAYLAENGAVATNCPTGAEFGKVALIIDGIFGIGLKRAPTGDFADAILTANKLRRESGALILAIDVPSGLCADSGQAFDASETGVIRADFTLTFLGHKPGLYTADGNDCCGEIRLDNLAIDLPAFIEKTRGSLLNRARAASLIPQRHKNSHKGSYGNVAIVGGAEGMVGAAVLAARAALHMGPGKVYLGLAAAKAMSFDAINPEIMLHPAKSLCKDPAMTALAIGMGLGQGPTAATLLKFCLAQQLPMVIDADALNLIAAKPQFGNLSDPSNGKRRAAKKPNWILAPHPGEAARLLDSTAAKVQRDRIGSACKLAARFHSVVVLKGAGTVVASPNGDYSINTSGNPGMASGGMGDALSGMMAAFLAQGLSALDAALLGVYLHGAAADACLSHSMAPLGLTASEVIFEARTLLNSGLEDHHE